MQPAPQIWTLGPDEIARFLLRYRRTDTLERHEPRLDHFLREILSKANEFVPSEAGVILLDDPRAKLFGSSHRELTYITVLGASAQPLLGERVPCNWGLVGQVYSSGKSQSAVVSSASDTMLLKLEKQLNLTITSALAVPVVVGSSICGVLQLFNRLNGPQYTEQDRTLIEIFAGYISSSMQNTLDALRAREVARRDNLTGLYNDRYLHFRLREELQRAIKSSEDLSLIFIDLDHFKEVNDQYGHLEGSRTLNQVGALLQSELPGGSVAARYGGDEFVVILPNANLEFAMHIAETLRNQIAETPFLAEAAPERGANVVTASIGVASLCAHLPPQSVEPIKHAETFIRLADTAMYRAKSLGKNTVVAAEALTIE